VICPSRYVPRFSHPSTFQTPESPMDSQSASLDAHSTSDPPNASCGLQWSESLLRFPSGKHQEGKEP